MIKIYEIKNRIARKKSLTSAKFAYIYHGMKKDIGILIKKYGNLDTVAWKLGVKKRTLQYALSGRKRVSEHLIKLIKLKARLVEIEDL